VHQVIARKENIKKKTKEAELRNYILPSSRAPCTSSLDNKSTEKGKEKAKQQHHGKHVEKIKEEKERNARCITHKA
jgi:hypothetical protein